MLIALIFCLLMLFSFYILLPWNVGMTDALDKYTFDFDTKEYIRNSIFDAPIWVHIIPWLSVPIILFTNNFIAFALAFLWTCAIIMVWAWGAYNLCKYTFTVGWGSGVTLRSILDKRKKEK